METSFAQRLVACAPAVHRAALGFLGDEQEAREVAQEALLRAWAARERFDSSRPLLPWLHAIVRNACRDRWAQRARRPRTVPEPEALPDRSPGPLHRLGEREARAAVARAMQHLSPEQREILVLRHFEDLSYAEIAALLGIPRGTVMSRLYRARRALLRELGELP